MKSTGYQDLLERVCHLSPSEQAQFLEALAAMVHRPTLGKRHRSVLELRGLGKEVWQGVDVQEYIKQERDSWDG